MVKTAWVGILFFLEDINSFHYFRNSPIRYILVLSFCSSADGFIIVWIAFPEESAGPLPRKNSFNAEFRFYSQFQNNYRYGFKIFAKEQAARGPLLYPVFGGVRFLEET